MDTSILSLILPEGLTEYFENQFLIEEQLEDRDWLKKLVSITVAELPEPKPKKKK